MDEKLFGPKVLPLMAPLLRTARRLSRSETEAEDLVQQAYLDAFETFRRVSNLENVRAWMFGILRNVWAERARRTQPTLRAVPTDDGEAEPACPAPGPDERLMWEATANELDQALRALDEPFRLTVVLVDVEGLSYAEAAEALGCPVGTIRSRLARGRAFLSSHLSQARRREERGAR